MIDDPHDLFGDDALIEAFRDIYAQLNAGDELIRVEDEDTGEPIYSGLLNEIPQELVDANLESLED